MKLNEVLSEINTEKPMIRRETWSPDEYLTYDFDTKSLRTSNGFKRYFDVNDVLADDWTFAETLEQKKLEKLYKILNDFYHTAGIDTKSYKDDLLAVLRMK